MSSWFDWGRASWRNGLRDRLVVRFFGSGQLSGEFGACDWGGKFSGTAATGGKVREHLILLGRVLLLCLCRNWY